MFSNISVLKTPSPLPNQAGILSPLLALSPQTYLPLCPWSEDPFSCAQDQAGTPALTLVKMHRLQLGISKQVCYFLLVFSARRVTWPPLGLATGGVPFLWLEVLPCPRMYLHLFCQSSRNSGWQGHDGTQTL